MKTLAIVSQVVVALGILNVWWVRSGRPTPYRPEGARNLAEEFRRYGLPGGFRRVVGIAKGTLALLLLIGIAYPTVATFAALGMALLMAGAFAAHWRVRDPLIKSAPALTLLALCLFIAYAQGGI